jgi:glycosyltransferase involved in cell wall biosynthesis/ribosomal protein S18 acetylase RimI-like enzyme
MKKLGIVVPVKNQADYILSCLNSLLNCDENDLDVVILDGGSTDGTLEICKRFVTSHSNFALMSGIDKGQSDAIAIGFSILETEWFGWLNGDDYLLPWTLPTLMNKIDEDQESLLIYGNGHFSDIQENWLRNYPTIDVGTGKFSDLIFDQLYLAQPSVFYKKSLYLESGGINRNLNYVFDYELWVKFSKILIDRQICYLPIELSGNREYPETKTQSKYYELLLELAKTQSKYFGKVSAYVVQAFSDYLYSSKSRNSPFNSYLKRFVYYKRSCIQLNLRRPDYALKLFFGVPLAQSGSIVNDRVGVFSLFKARLNSKFERAKSPKSNDELSIQKTNQLNFIDLEFHKLSEIETSTLEGLFLRIREEDPGQYFSPHGFDVQTLTRMMEAKKDTHLMVRYLDEFVGYILLRGFDEGYDDLSLGIFVYKSFRGTGVANLLLKYLESLALSQGARQLRLSVKSDNYAAKRLYAKLQYRQKDLRDDGSEIWMKDILTASP